MKKMFINLSVATVVASGLSGCFGGGNLTEPVTKRAQDINPKVMNEVRKNAPLDLEKRLKRKDKNGNPIYTNMHTYTLGELKTKNRKLYNLIYPIAKEAQKFYTQRNLPADITKNGPQWLIGDVDNLKIIITKTNSGRFGGRYSPYNDLLIFNYNDKVNKLLADFLIAHEFSHALALHATEDQTKYDEAQKGAGNAANVALDVALNEAYLKLDPKTKNLINTAAEKVFPMILTQKDIDAEKKILEKRENSFTVKMAKKAGQQDKLNKLGVNLQIPLKTKMVLKYLINYGLNTTGAINALKGGMNFATANVITIEGHPKTQELEADKIALFMLKDMGINPLPAVCKRFAGNKPAGLFDQHPSYPERRKNLGCK